MFLTIAIASACSLTLLTAAARTGLLGHRRFDIAAEEINPDTSDDYTSDIYVRTGLLADVVYRDLMYNGFPRAPMRAVATSLRPVDLYVNGVKLAHATTTVRCAADQI